MEKQKGFTLMELLIVIGVLGILAAGLLAAIDPFEQLKKARDANNRNASIELMNAFTRYYATHGEFPWNLDTPVYCNGVDASDDPGSISGGAVEAQSISACVAALENDGELKDDFLDNISTDLYIASESDTNIRVCFAPEGKASRTDSLTKWILTGAGPYTITEDDAGDTCPDPTGEAVNCLQCFQ